VALVVIGITACAEYEWQVDVESTLVPKEDIRTVTSNRALIVEHHRGNLPRYVSAIPALALARRQAALWSDSTELILAYEANRFHVSTGDGPVGHDELIVVWAFVFKNASGSAWLGVTVDSEGIVDAASRIVPDRALQLMSAVGEITRDSDRYHNDTGRLSVPTLTLTAVSPRRAVWIVVDVAGRDWASSQARQGLATGRRTNWITVIDAVSGEDVTESVLPTIDRKLAADQLQWLEGIPDSAKQ
jgi:hypothetical protein